MVMHGALTFTFTLLYYKLHIKNYLPLVAFGNDPMSREQLLTSSRQVLETAGSAEQKLATDVGQPGIRP